MSKRVAIIGDADLIFPLRALGLKVYSPLNIDEARQVLSDLESEEIGLCFLHERFFEPLAKEREALQKKFTPVIAGFSDYREVTDYLAQTIREMAIKATGSDALVKGRKES
jgi:vacuolar-type H+-ATPase subunit F/Vma7